MTRTAATPVEARSNLTDVSNLALRPMSLPLFLGKGIRPGWVMLSQETAVIVFYDESTIREHESNFVVERPFVPSLRVESQRNAAVRDFFFRWVALDL